MRNVKKILDCCSKLCVVHVLRLLPLFALYFLSKQTFSQTYDSQKHDCLGTPSFQGALVNKAKNRIQKIDVSHCDIGLMN